MADRYEGIDFADLARALLDRAEILLPQWLPGGKRNGAEYVCADLEGGAGRSLSVNLVTGAWADFAGDDRGGDLISLYAAIRGLNQGQAARQLMQDLGWTKSSYAPIRSSSPAGEPRQASMSEPPPPDDNDPGSDDGAGGRRKSMWRPIVPVPEGAPAPTFKHWHYTEVERSWEYTRDGQRYGYVVRFRTSDGGKEILPYTWCVDESDTRGTRRWHWKQWEDPRPLYLAAGLLASDPRLVPVVLVEGEKCAQAGHELLGHEFDFVSWPSGSKAWAKANWAWLAGRVVILWPDCDGKRQRLTKDEREAGVAPETKPFLPEARQPGMAAMLGIGSLLLAEHACTVTMCPVPEPGAVSDGWDIADAIESGWDAERVRAFIRGARTFVPPDDAVRAKVASTPSIAGAAQDEGGQAWRAGLLTSSTGAVKPVRENVTLALGGIPEVQGVIAYNEFTNDVFKLKDAPWDSPAGLWEEVDELNMGEWLTREHYLPSMPRGTLEEAVRMVSWRNRYHPVRAYLQGLQWDGTKRCATWLRRCCLVEDEWDDREALQQYLARVGTWFLMGMCARVMQPGVKFDYMLILEGAQGMRKSTLLAKLAGAFFADTGLVLGDKDSYQQLQGRWLYEWPELDAFSKADITRIKAFIASQSDYFRASFDKRARDYPRQVVFGGTTNEDHYLVDPTGNRRFWPVRVTRIIDIDWLCENRDQLFAEAMSRVNAGARMHPTPEEERDLFMPQQQQRTVESAIAAKIAGYLHPLGNPTGPNSDGMLVTEISLVDLLGKIGIGIEKLGPGRFHEKQAAAALRSLGWAERRSSAPGRPRLYCRPEEPASGSSSTRPTQGDSPAGSDDDCPF